MEYFGYIRRDPDAAGVNLRLGWLGEFGGDYVRAEAVKAFFYSTQYRQGFGPQPRKGLGLEGHHQERGRPPFPGPLKPS
ncbi:MAG TPA: hypothetical protein VF586_18925 [Pyrinomonadaceae bacterium]|jgi:hypothetical protein